MSNSTLSEVYKIYERIHSILAAILFISLGNSILMILLPINLKEVGMMTSTIGWVMAGYSMGMIIGSKYGYKIIARIGHNRVYAMVASVIAICAMMHTFVENVWVVFILRILVGIAMAMVYLTLESWLGAKSENSSRGVVYGLYQLFFCLGALTAPFASAIFGHDDLRSINLVALFASLSLIPLMLTRFPSPEIESSQETMPIKEMLRDTPSASVTIFVVGLSLSALLSLTSLLAYSLNLTTIQIAVMVASTTASSILFQVPVGWISGKIDERKVMLALMTIAFISSIAAYLTIQLSIGWYWTTLSIFFLGGCTFCLYPLSIKFIFNHIESNQALPAMSTLLLINGTGMIIGPIAASLMMETFGFSFLFIYLAIVLLPALLFMIYRVIVSSSPSEDAESVPYIITVQTLRPMSASLDPRSDYLLTKVSNVNLRALASSIGISPSKSLTFIQQHLNFLDGFQPPEILEGLVMLKPRLAQPIIRAMLILFPDSAITFTETLKDLISLNKTNINRLLLRGLTHQADSETKQKIKALFKEFTTPAPE